MEEKPGIPSAVEWVLAIWIVVAVLVGGWLIWGGIRELRKFGMIGIAMGTAVILVGVLLAWATRRFIQGRQASHGAQVAMAVFGPPALLGILFLLWVVTNR